MNTSVFMTDVVDLIEQSGIILLEEELEYLFRFNTSQEFYLQNSSLYYFALLMGRAIDKSVKFQIMQESLEVLSIDSITQEFAEKVKSSIRVLEFCLETGWSQRFYSILSNLPHEDSSKVLDLMKKFVPLSLLEISYHRAVRV